MPESAVDVEVVLNTNAGRQSKNATVGRIEPKGTATVEIDGSIPGAFDEAAEAGPVKYEKTMDNNTLEGSVTFGL